MKATQVADLLFIQGTAPRRHEARLTDRAAALGDDIQEKLIIHLIHDRAVGVIGWFGRQRFGRHAVAFAFLTMAGRTIAGVKFPPLRLILRRARVPRLAVTPQKTAGAKDPSFIIPSSLSMQFDPYLLADIR